MHSFGHLQGQILQDNGNSYFCRHLNSKRFTNADKEVISTSNSKQAKPQSFIETQEARSLVVYSRNCC